MNKLILDFETRSTVDIKKVGAWAYASNPSTDIICLGWVVDDGPVTIYKRGEVKIPQDFWIFDDPANRFIAHNYVFEYACWHFIMHKRYGWPAILDPKKWDCTMARALMCGLPASLEGAALALKLPIQKDLEGRAALLKICKPQKDGTFNEDPALYQRVYDYNKIDVETERELDKALPPLSEDERKIFELDLMMNRRGVAVDLRSAQKAQEIADTLTMNLNEDLYRLTDGAVSKATRIQEMKRWIVTQGVKVPTKGVDTKDEEGAVTTEEKETLDKEAIGDLFKDERTPQNVKDVIAIRQQVGKSSVSKFRAMVACACGDGRVRGALQYHGAHTGRWAGRNIQPQNYPQGLVGGEQEQAIGLLSEGAELFKGVYNSRSMWTLSGILRGMLVPSPGKIFIGADYNAIEARVLFFLAQELDALAEYRAGGSPYLTMGERIYGKKIAKKENPQEYDIAKRSVLGCGFGLGWTRFQSNVYTETAKYGTAVEISDALAQKAVTSYREKYRRVVGFWYETESAAKNAVTNPGQIFQTANGCVLWGMSKDRRFLVAKLPSGRCLRYYRPKVRMENDRRGNEKLTLFYWTSAGEGAIKTEANGYLGLYRTWGGELVENVVQAVARDIMANGMLQVESAGYPLVLTVHDELVAEINEGEDVEVIEFTNLMCKLPSWAFGCPITAEGWTGRRYRK